MNGIARPEDGVVRHRLELLALVGCGLLAAAMGMFLVVDWASDAVPLAAVMFERYLAAGTWLDGVLGRRLFFSPSVWRALATGIFIGIAAPLIGVFLIHRQMALIGETLAHTAFAGVAAGVVILGVSGWRGNLVVVDLGSRGSLLLVALVVSALGALGLQWLRTRSRTYGDVPIAIVLAGSFAVGTLLITWGRDRTPITIDVEGFLFGSLAIVTAAGARIVAVLTVVVVFLVGYYYKELLFITFDEQAATVARLPVGRFNTLLIVMTAVVVVGAMQILGVILVAAMLVVPAAAASQLGRSFRETVYLAVIAGQVSVLGGMGTSLLAGLPPGGSIVVVAIAIYLLAVFVGGRRPSGISAY